MGEHKHGSTDPTPHQKTFEGLIKVMVLIFAVSAVVLIFLAIVGT